MARDSLAPDRPCTSVYFRSEYVAQFEACDSAREQHMLSPNQDVVASQTLLYLSRNNDTALLTETHCYQHLATLHGDVALLPLWCNDEVVLQRHCFRSDALRQPQTSTLSEQQRRSIPQFHPS